MKNLETQQLKDHFNRILTYSDFKLELLGNNISTKELFEIAEFKVKYHTLKLTGFKSDLQSEKLIEKCLLLSHSIIDLKR